MATVEEVRAVAKHAMASVSKTGLAEIISTITGGMPLGDANEDQRITLLCIFTAIAENGRTLPDIGSQDVDAIAMGLSVLGADIFNGTVARPDAMQKFRGTVKTHFTSRGFGCDF